MEKNPMNRNTTKIYGSQIKELWEQGLSLSVISQEIGISIYRVRNVVYKTLNLRRGHKRTRKNRTKALQVNSKLCDRIIHLYSWGYSATEIKDDVKLPVEIISTIIQKSDVKRRVTESDY